MRLRSHSAVFGRVATPPAVQNAKLFHVCHSAALFPRVPCRICIRRRRCYVTAVVPEAPDIEHTCADFSTIRSAAKPQIRLSTCNTIRAGLKLWEALGQYPIPAGLYILYTGVGKFGDFRRKSPFIPETVRDRPGNNPKHFSLFSWDRL